MKRMWRKRPDVPNGSGSLPKSFLGNDLVRLLRLEAVPFQIPGSLQEPASMPSWIWQFPHDPFHRSSRFAAANAMSGMSARNLNNMIESQISGRSADANPHLIGLDDPPMPRGVPVSQRRDR